MMRQILAVPATCVGVLAIAMGPLAAAEDVLFIGNSITIGQDNVLPNSASVNNFNKANVTDEYNKIGRQQTWGYGGVPGIFKSLATHASYDANVSIDAVGGQSLAQRFNNTTQLPGFDPGATNDYDERIYIMRRPTWDCVVLQEGMSGANSAAYTAYRDAATNIVGAVHNSTYGNPLATIVLYETYAYPQSTILGGGTYQSLEAMQADVRNANAIVASSLGRNTVVAPVGDAFMNAIALGGASNNPFGHAGADPNPYDNGFVDNPGTFDLWTTSDGNPSSTPNLHASKFGYYLAGLVLHETITGYDSSAFSATYAGSTAQALGISESDAKYLNWVAHTTVSPGPTAISVALTGGNHLEMAFSRRRADVSYIVQGSNDLAEWTDLATNPGTIGQPVTFTDAVDLATQSKRFLRLKVSRP